MLFYRLFVIQERTRLINRIQKVLEDANIKLTSVVTDMMGMTGQAILLALLAGEVDPERLARLARGSLVKKQDQRKRSMEAALLLLVSSLKQEDKRNLMLPPPVSSH